MDHEVQQALDERDMKIAALESIVAEQRDLLAGLINNGLDALFFANLFPTSGGSAGTARQAARSDHVH